ncbi:carbon-nitrogen hydrolase family protein [Rhodopseudomonas sp. HC1]|uniref:carbon-nitrogen hydrolase family protein n=1 Tax=Rhodopseudomonas infernalis TaxID=2897386 RepID=UPI001EE8CE6D|nr:carbon-nitrogen hydrolase family protein [Rhodopseudomonas infernalis]MCG6206300.1 carbon-nitrogen hydrolase family protein [Rhodopseudomonas infernalis]
MLQKADFQTSAPAGRVVVAAAQAVAPLFDIRAGVAKCCELIAQAAAGGARLIVFPESFLPGFPIWNGFYRPIDAHSFFGRFAANALQPSGGLFAEITSAAARHRIFVSLGFCEVSERSRGCMWNSQALISDQGELINHHRKLVPTFYEQLSWNRGDAAGLRVVDTSIGRIGGLICGENNNPLARYALMSEAEEIHCACYPSIWPFRNPVDSAPYDLRQAIHFRAAAHSFEAKVFTVVAAGVLDEPTIATVSAGDAEIEKIMRACPQANSMVIGPMGNIIAELPPGEEGLLFAEVDLRSLVELKQHHDMAGYYHRGELFRVGLVRERPQGLKDAVIDSPLPARSQDPEQAFAMVDETYGAAVR